MSLKHYYKDFWSVESKFIPCFTVKNIVKKLQRFKLCITGGRGSNQEIGLVLKGEDCSDFTQIQFIY